MEWCRNLRIVLSTEDKLPFLEQPIPVLPVPPQGQANPPDMQKTLKHLGAYDMLNERKTLYVQQAYQELLQTVRELHACKQEEGQSVSSYVLKMKSYIDNLERLGHAMTPNLSVSLILVSLRKECGGFVQNYNMHSMGKTVNELHAMLKLHEQTLPPKEVAPAFHAIRAGRIQKTKRKNRIRLQRAIKGKAKRRWAMHLYRRHLLLPNPRIHQHPKRIIQQRTRYATNVVRWATREETALYIF
ncbi:hypothetical protein Tco_1227890 [Tanacetum coccineum]